MVRRASGRSNGRANDGALKNSGNTTNDASSNDTKDSPTQTSIQVTYLFFFVAVAISFLIAFSIGWASRLILLANVRVITMNTYDNMYINSNDSGSFLSISGKSQKKAPVEEDESGGMSGKLSIQLPAPKVIAGKDVPYTTYTSKTFHTAAAITANTLHIDRSTALLMMTKSKKDYNGGPDFTDDDVAIDTTDATSESKFESTGWVPCHEDAGSKCSRGKEKPVNSPESDDVDAPVNDYSHNSDEDGLHLPAGQHLLVDIKDVDAQFLNSEERLATAMISLINESKLTLLSYHCHSLVPIGVSCAGVLLESHIAFHTWPLEGVITLDLFTCGGNPLIPVMPSIERLFGVARESIGDEEVVKPSLLWAHKLRGFREGFAPGYVRTSNPLDGDLGRYVLGKLDFDLKTPLISTKTEFQSVDVYELLYPRLRNAESYQKSLKDRDSYEYENPELFAPDRVLFLDGVIQSTHYGDAPYHESIVHPAMITHSNPKRVAIVGGGEGATLREVLKHGSVEKATMIEIDEDVVDISKEFLPEWSNCSDIVGSAEWCFDDERVDSRFEDAMEYFKSRFATKTLAAASSDERVDVIIMDALDPNDEIEFAVELYQSESFIGSLYKGLTDSGILAVQVGETPDHCDPPDEADQFANRQVMLQKLQDVGFKSIHIYTESHSGFIGAWSTLVAFKDYETRTNWYRSTPEIDLAIRKRILPTKSGADPLRFFDGGAQFLYQVPAKPFEVSHCRSEETPDACRKYRGFNPGDAFVPASDLEVKKSKKGKGVFASKKVLNHARIALDEQVKGLITRPSTWAIMKNIQQGSISQLTNYFEALGVCNVFLGQTHCCSTSGIIGFINRNSKRYNFGDWTSTQKRKLSIYSPVVDRHLRQILSASKMTLRDINAGEEIILGNAQ